MLAGVEASTDGSSLFAGSSRTCCCSNRGRHELPGGSSDLQGQRCQRGEVVAALPRDGERSGAQSWRPAALCAARPAGLAAGAVGGEARHHAACAGCGTGGARDQGELLRRLALLRARRYQLQKKACTPANKTVPTSPGDGRSGESIKGGLILLAWSSSTRRGPRPT